MYDTYDGRDGQRSQTRKAMIFLFCALAISVSFIIYHYNQLMDKLEDVNLAQSNVEAMMQRKLELIPDLVATVKDFTEHEETIFAGIESARQTLENCLNSGNLEQAEQANQELTKQLETLVSVVVEDYPELASSRAYIALMDQLEGSANRIAVARQDYNDAVSAYNRAIKRYPAVIYARILGFKEIQPFKADEAANQPNMVDFG